MRSIFRRFLVIAGFSQLWLSSVLAQVPEIYTGGYSVWQDSAVVGGTLASTGGAAATVYVLWGTNDHAGQAALWDNELSLGPKNEGSTSTTLPGLLSDTDYFYRFAASNSYGMAVAATTMVFRSSFAKCTVGSGVVHLPQNYSFEDMTNGTPIESQNGWLVRTGESGASVTLAPDHGLRSDWLTGAIHSRVLDLRDSACVNVARLPLMDYLYVDMIVKLEARDQPPFLAKPCPAFAVYLDSSNQIQLFHGYYDESNPQGQPGGYQKVWTAVTAAPTEGSPEWVKLTFSLDYSDSIYMDTYAQLAVNNVLLDDPMGYADTTFNYEPDGGTWFMACDLPVFRQAAISNVSFNTYSSGGIAVFGVQQVDDLTLSANGVLGPHSPPEICNYPGPSELGSRSATLRSTLSFECNASYADTYFWYGRTDAGQATGDWESCSTVVSATGGVVCAEISGLTPGDWYYYRCFATNFRGGVWSPSSSRFRAGVDGDNDGLDDAWEVEVFGSTTNCDGTADSDGDGLLDAEEYWHGGEPDDADSDDDGMSDADEVLVGTAVDNADDVFELDQDCSAGTGGVNVLRWETLDDRYYSLIQITNLCNTSTWQTLLYRRRGRNGELVFTNDSGALPNCYYMLKAGMQGP